MEKKEPLRKIVDHFIAIEKDSMGVSHQRHYDVLECGHMVRQSESTYSRRCRECGITMLAVDRAKRGSEVTVIAKFEDGELVSERVIRPATKARRWTDLVPRRRNMVEFECPICKKPSLDSFAPGLMDGRVLRCDFCQTEFVVKFESAQPSVQSDGATVVHKEWCIGGDKGPCNCGAEQDRRAGKA